MLQSILISPDESLNDELLAALRGTGEVEVVRVLKTYPRVEDLLLAIRVRKPQFLFVSVEDFPRAEALAAQIDDFLPGLPIVALGRHLEVDVLPKLMHLGIREYLTSPINPSKLAGIVDSTKRFLRKHPSPVFHLADLYTFLPAKPGVGCSTLAVSTSCALAEDIGARTLLIDCDLAAGAIKFLLKLGNSASILDAIGHAGSLDEDLWSQLVGKWDKLDVLHAGELNPPPNIDLGSLHAVLAIARAQYQVVCVDLASSLDQFSVDLIRESRRVFVVSTPEVVPLHLASQRIRSLENLGLGDKVSFLLNRKSSRGSVADAEVIQSVGLPMAFSFSNDYIGVGKSILDGSPVHLDSELGHSILNLAESLTPGMKPTDKSKRKFLEFFHVPRTEALEEVWRD